MKIILITLTILLVQLTGSLAEASSIPPLKHDWSVTQGFRTTVDTSIHNPILQDPDGNFHIISLGPTTGSQGLRLNYSSTTPKFAPLDNHSVFVPHFSAPRLSTKLASALTETGPLVAVATPEGESWQLHLVQLDFEANVVDVQQLDFHIPGTDSTFNEIVRLNLATDSHGNTHLVVLGGETSWSLRHYYFKYDSDFTLIQTEEVGRWGDANTLLGGQVLTDSLGNAWVLVARANELLLEKFPPNGEKESFDIGDQAWMGTVYSSRKQPPTMALDSNDVIHITWNALSRTTSRGVAIVGVNYMRFHDGEIIDETMISNSIRVSHFPNLTIFQDNVYISWEEEHPLRGTSLIFSKLDLHGEPVFEHIQFGEVPGGPTNTWVYGTPSGQTVAFYRIGPLNNAALIGQTTKQPQGGTLWGKLGFEPGSKQNPIWSQVIWFMAMTLLYATTSFLTNLHLVLALVIFMWLLYRIGLLERALSRSGFFMAFCLTISVVFIIPPAVSTRVMNPGYQVYAALGAALLLILGKGLFQLKFDSSLKFISGCMVWMLLNLMLQVIPSIPYLRLLG